DRDADIGYARAASGTVLKLGVLPRGRKIDWSVEFEGSLYWFMHADPEVDHQDVLMAANLDGSDVREAVRLSPQQGQAVFGQNLGSYRGSLYCLIRKTITNPTQTPQVQLARIHPGRPCSLDILPTLPPGMVYTA